MSELIVCKVADHAKIPEQQPGSVGYDVFAFGNHIISPGETKIIPIGCNFALPHGYGAFVWDRSSFGLRGIHVFRELVENLEKLKEIFDIVPFGGVLDWSYRGQVGVILHSFLPYAYTFNHHDRITQVVVQKCETWPVRVVTPEEYAEIPTDRGAKGLGSSDGRTAEDAQKLISGAATSSSIKLK